jgi:hypothetical protein
MVAFPGNWLYKSINQGIIMNTEKSVKKNSTGKMRIVKIESHSTAYFIENKFLACSPLLIGGEPCMESSCIVEEAPKNYRVKHIKALKLLGVRKNEIDSYLKKVNYYDE